MFLHEISFWSLFLIQRHMKGFSSHRIDINISSVCVCKLCVSKFCGDKLGVSKRRAAERRGQAEVHNQQQKPHKDVGKNKQLIQV